MIIIIDGILLFISLSQTLLIRM